MLLFGEIGVPSFRTSSRNFPASLERPSQAGCNPHRHWNTSFPCRQTVLLQPVDTVISAYDQWLSRSVLERQLHCRVLILQRANGSYTRTHQRLSIIPRHTVGIGGGGRDIALDAAFDAIQNLVQMVEL